MAAVSDILVSKIKVEDIRKAAIEHGWTLVSEEYHNLNEELTFECAEGHKVYFPYKKVRDKWECPICEQNKYHNFTGEVKPKNKEIQRTLGLDQATHITGYSIFDGTELIDAGMFETHEENEIQRDLEMRNWLIQMIQTWKPDVIGMEDIQLQVMGKTTNVATYRTLARLQGILMATCEELHVDYVVCPPATWRFNSGVKGRTRSDKKRSMQMKVKEWFDITVSDDVADAIGIGKYISEHHKKKVEIINWE